MSQPLQPTLASQRGSRPSGHAASSEQHSNSPGSQPEFSMSVISQASPSQFASWPSASASQSSFRLGQGTYPSSPSRDEADDVQGKSVQELGVLAIEDPLRCTEASSLLPEAPASLAARTDSQFREEDSGESATACSEMSPSLPLGDNSDNAIETETQSGPASSECTSKGKVHARVGSQADAETTKGVHRSTEVESDAGQDQHQPRAAAALSQNASLSPADSSSQHGEIGEQTQARIGEYHELLGMYQQFREEMADYDEEAPAVVALTEEDDEDEATNQADSAGGARAEPQQDTRRLSDARTLRRFPSEAEQMKWAMQDSIRHQPKQAASPIVFSQIDLTSDEVSSRKRRAPVPPATSGSLSTSNDQPSDDVSSRKRQALVPPPTSGVPAASNHRPLEATPQSWGGVRRRRKRELVLFDMDGVLGYWDRQQHTPPPQGSAAVANRLNEQIV